MSRLPVLCPQEYVGIEMRVVPCTRCSSGWDAASRSCLAETGCEDIGVVAAVPDCPIQERCQHQAQATGPCEVRARGMICASALSHAGIDPQSHPLAFSYY